MELKEHTDDELMRSLHELCGQQSKITAELVAHLGEVEERRLHLLAGYSSMFDFCVNKLRFSESAAYRRLLAARLGRRFPVVHAMLASGAVHLSALELLNEHLTEENHFELLDAVTHKSKREVEQLLAVRFPRPDLPSRIRRLPQSGGNVELVAGGGDIANSVAQAKRTREHPGKLQPLSESRYKIEFTASSAVRDKLEQARNLMSHSNPSRDLEAVIDRALDLLLEELAKTKRAKVKTKRTLVPSKSNRAGYVSRATRRAVFERDGNRCTFVSADGHRCDACALLELDHIVPRALGGSDDESNLRVRCRSHNLLWVEQVYGREHVDERKHFRRRERSDEQSSNAPTTAPAQSAAMDVDCGRSAESQSQESAASDVRRALERLGFRARASQNAVQKAASVLQTGTLLDESSLRVTLLRESLVLLTAEAGAADTSRLPADFR